MIFLIPVNNFTTISKSSFQNQKNLDTVPTPQTVSQDYSQLLNKYIQGLINQSEIIPNASNATKWKKYLNLPVNDPNLSQYYYGLYYGASGIGMTFLQLFSETKNMTYLQIAEKAGNYLLLNAEFTTNRSLTAWNKSEDDFSIYTGEKYGLAGITTFLLNLYQYSNNNTYLLFAETTLQLLYNFRSVTPYGYAYNYTLVGGYQASITDYIYGATGVAKSFLTAYLVTNKQTYLNDCTNIMSWVLNMSDYTSLATNGLRRVLYSQDPSYWDYFTGYQSGAAGIGDFLLTLYNITNKADYLLYAEQMGNWLLYEENGTGIWSSYNAVDYLTNQYTTNKQGTFLGYSAGASGVAIYLMRLYEFTHDSVYLGPVIRVKNLLIENELTNGSQIFWKAQLIGGFANRIDTSLSIGVAGIGLFFIKYYEYFGDSEALGVLDGINNFYSAITTSTGLVPYLLNTSSVVYDSSYFDGLAGIMIY